MTWIDIHSHILPGFDDGAANDREFLEMARVAAGGGTTLMAATPHYDIESPAFEPADVAVAVESHNALLCAEGIDLTLVPGVEVRVNAGLFELAEAGSGLEKLGLAGQVKYMLVDLPLQSMPLATPDILFRVQLAGFNPILAHPERNRYLVEHKSAVVDLAEKGIELQVNSGSLQGIFGKSARRMARRLLGEGVARLVASDAHQPTGRGPNLTDTAPALERLLGKGAARVLMEVNPGRVLEGQVALEEVNRPGSGSETARRRPWRLSR